VRSGGRNKITKANRRNDRARRRRDAKRALGQAAATLKTVYDREKGTGSLPQNLQARVEKEDASETHLYKLDYPSPCKIKECRSRATTLARGFDSMGRSMGQIELCDPHAKGLKLKRHVDDRRV
jgi:hypothetical protein